MQEAEGAVEELVWCLFFMPEVFVCMFFSPNVKGAVDWKATQIVEGLRA